MTLFEFEDDRYILETAHDFQGMDFVFYDEPVQHYSLINISKKIGSFDELTYLAEVFLHLNVDVDFKIYLGYFCWLGSRDSGMCIRTYGKARIEHFLRQIFFTRKKPYCRRYRRVIFNPEKIISNEEKLSITAQVIRRGCSFTDMDVLLAIGTLRDQLLVATSKSIASYLNCSTSTVSRLINKEIRDKMKSYNELTREEQKIRILLENIELLTSNGEGLKVRALKELTSIRDYSLIKKAMDLFLRDERSSFLLVSCMLCQF